MASHGALKEQAATTPAAPKKPPQFLRHMELQKADNGGVVARHVMNNYDGKDAVHAFGDGEGHKLAAHIEKHLGIKMPGKSEVNESEEHEGDENEHKSEE